jgi:hypothetical protein
MNEMAELKEALMRHSPFTLDEFLIFKHDA